MCTIPAEFSVATLSLAPALSPTPSLSTFPLEIRELIAVAVASLGPLPLFNLMLASREWHDTVVNDVPAWKQLAIRLCKDKQKTAAVKQPQTAAFWLKLYFETCATRCIDCKGGGASPWRECLTSRRGKLCHRCRRLDRNKVVYAKGLAEHSLVKEDVASICKQTLHSGLEFYPLRDVKAIAKVKRRTRQRELDQAISALAPELRDHGRNSIVEGQAGELEGVEELYDAIMLAHEAPSMEAVTSLAELMQQCNAVLDQVRGFPGSNPSLVAKAKKGLHWLCCLPEDDSDDRESMDNWLVVLTAGAKTVQDYIKELASPTISHSPYACQSNFCDLTPALLCTHTMCGRHCPRSGCPRHPPSFGRRSYSCSYRYYDDEFSDEYYDDY